MIKEVLAIVFISGISAEDVQKTSQDFANSYWNRGDGVEILIHTSKTNKTEHVIKLNNSDDFQLFTFLVNYLAYSKSGGERLQPRGYWKIKAGQHISNQVPLEKVMLFVPLTDDEFDNVYAVSKSGQSMKLGFALGHEYTPLPADSYSYVESDFDSTKFQEPVMIKSNPPLSMWQRIVAWFTNQ